MVANFNEDSSVSEHSPSSMIQRASRRVKGKRSKPVEVERVEK